MHEGQRLSLIFPAYNEEKNIEKAVQEFKALGVFDEILVIDNNSKDQTEALARKAGARVISEPKQGYGHALRRGLDEALGDLIFLAEPDGTFAPHDVWKFLAYASDFDLVLGT